MSHELGPVKLTPSSVPGEIKARITLNANGDIFRRLIAAETVLQSINSDIDLSISTRPFSSSPSVYLVFDLICRNALSESGKSGDSRAPAKWIMSSSRGSPFGREGYSGFANYRTKSNGVFCSFESGPWGLNGWASGQSISLDIEFTMPKQVHAVPPKWAEFPYKAWKNTSFKFGRLLLNSSAGDIVFVVRATDGTAQMLYAYKSVLAGNNEYFAARFASEWSQPPSRRKESKMAQEAGEMTGDGVKRLRTPNSVQVLDPGEFTASGGSSRKPVGATSLFSSLSESRELICFDEPEDDIDFVTLHNILYFIYIGRVNLPSLGEKLDDDPPPEGFPKTPDPFMLFKNADKFLLPELKEYCSYFLTRSLTPSTVVLRLFHPDVQLYPELKARYIEYFTGNFEAVKATKEWEDVAGRELDENESLYVTRYRTRLMFELFSKLGGAKK